MLSLLLDASSLTQKYNNNTTILLKCSAPIKQAPRTMDREGSITIDSSRFSRVRTWGPGISGSELTI
ncbi:unnamed protein product [Gordionus sp. m RMFG-2023]